MVLGKLMKWQYMLNPGGIATKYLGGIIHRNADTIGKAAGGIGRKYLSSTTRNNLSNIADTAIKYMPNGTIKDTLRTINNNAQGRVRPTGKPIEGKKARVIG